MVNELITQNKILKLSLLFIVFLAMSIYVSAQGIELKLIEYNPETSHARLQIRNLESKSLKNVSLIIDNNLPYFIVGALSPGNAIVHSRNIQAGNHHLTITTKEGITTSKDMLFTKSREELTKEQEVTKPDEVKNNISEVLPHVEPKKSRAGKVILIGTIFLLLIGLMVFIYWYVNIRHTPKIKAQNYIPKPIHATPVRLTSKSPEQIRKALKERAIKRQEMLEKLMRK